MTQTEISTGDVEEIKRSQEKIKEALAEIAKQLENIIVVLEKERPG